VETHGPLGTLWVGAALSAFYIALIWLNALLGHMLTPLFLLPATWFIGGRRRGDREREAGREARAERREVREEDIRFVGTPRDRAR
jgi:hypothetical protein